MSWECSNKFKCLIRRNICNYLLKFSYSTSVTASSGWQVYGWQSHRLGRLQRMLTVHRLWHFIYCAPPPLSRYLGCKLCVSCSVRSNPSVSGFIAQFAPGESSGICSPSPLVASTVDKQGTSTIIGRHMKARSFERRTCVQPPWLPRTMDSVRALCSDIRALWSVRSSDLSAESAIAT